MLVIFRRHQLLVSTNSKAYQHISNNYADNHCYYYYLTNNNTVSTNQFQIYQPIIHQPWPSSMGTACVATSSRRSGWGNGQGPSATATRWCLTNMDHCSLNLYLIGVSLRFMGIEPQLIWLCSFLFIHSCSFAAISPNAWHFREVPCLLESPYRFTEIHLS